MMTVASGERGTYTLGLTERGKPDPLLTLDPRTSALSAGRFSRDGQAHASENQSGTTVTVIDLHELQQR